MNIPILMYHQTDVAPPSGTPLRGLVVSPGAFSRQMLLLKCMGYQGLSMRELEPYLGGQRQGKVVGITFDDGYQNNLTNALPILRQHGFSATCYAVSGMIGEQNSWDLKIGVPQKQLMTQADWLHWIAAGMDVGSHTSKHTDLTTVTSDEARAAIEHSRTELQQALGYDARHFCYPYGRFTEDHVAIVRDAGYLSATTTNRGRATQHDPKFTLKRVLMAHATTPVHLALKVTTSYEDKRGR
jgi:peptidoglycan/xylan/chitin deacetylase (PgdA/CDA1 family)